MRTVVPKRSTGGCLTCKKRRKKCDERRPYCNRCETGDFHCLGYSPPATEYTGGPDITGTGLIHRTSHTPSVKQSELRDSNLKSLDALIPLPGHEDQVGQLILAHTHFRELKSCQDNIPREITLDQIPLEDITSLIVSQYTRFSREVLFKEAAFSVEGLLRRIDRSGVARWSMYLSARVVVDLLNGINVQKYLGWVFRFCQQITDASTSSDLVPNLGGQLDGLYDLVSLGSMLSGTATGYSLLRRCTSVFLRLAASEPHIWVDDSQISVPDAFRGSRFEVAQFIIYDVISSLALGTPSLLPYDTTSWTTTFRSHYLEWIYGFPVEIFIYLVQINARRTAWMIGGTAGDTEGCHEIEKHLRNWDPVADHTEGSSKIIARLAVQEAWRQAALVYLYMGMGGVNSADPRIETAVRQVVQLGSTIETGSSFELHLMVPSLVAGVAARWEKHRAALRSKVACGLLRKVNPQVLPIRGSDFIAVLDHLWHGAGSDGNPVTWEDYVGSRCAVLPVTH